MNLSVSEWTTIALTIGAALIQACVFGVLVRRKIRSDFPVFLVYNAYAALAAVALAVCFIVASMPSASQHFYFYVYWTLNALFMVLQFGVMYEIFVNALKPYAGLIDLGKMLFGWAAVFLLLAATLTAFATAGSTAAKCIAAVSLMERTLRLMQCGLLLLFFVFERRLALSWRSYPVSLALGLGTFAALGLVFSYLRTHFVAWTPRFDIMDNAAYLGVVAYWAFCFVQAEAVRKNVLDSPSKLIFQRWNEALIASRANGAAASSVESFLPGIEQTVDRVMARKAIH